MMKNPHAQWKSNLKEYFVGLSVTWLNNFFPHSLPEIKHNRRENKRLFINFIVSCFSPLKLELALEILS